MSPLEEMLLRRRQSARRHTDGLGPLMVPCLIDGREVLGELLAPIGRAAPSTPRGSVIDIEA